jgi:subtilisin family serine protease
MRQFGGPMDPLEVARLPRLMKLTRGRADVVVGLVDGPVALEHPDLATRNIRTLGGVRGACQDPGSASCRHGTFVAGILAARRGARAPAIAPDCTLLVRPVFLEARVVGEQPSATPGELAEAIVDCVDAGARIVNLSAALAGRSFGADRELGEALEYSTRWGVLVVAAAGNQGAVAGSTITRHPWVIPVVACDHAGWPFEQSNLGRSIGSRGLGAPGQGVVSLAPEGDPAVSAGTSVAAPFVTGAAALLWSVFPDATAVEVKRALLSSRVGRRTTVVPPLLDAWGAYEVLSGSRARRAVP